MKFKEYIVEGIFDSKQIKKFKEMFFKFNKVEDAILLVTNSSNEKNPSTGLTGMIKATSTYTDGTRITKRNIERIKKINKLSEEILSLSNEIKTEIVVFFGEKYPEDWQKFIKKYS